MRLLKSYTFKWWQFGIFKLALLSIGALIGAYWAEFFTTNMTLVLAVAVAASLYAIAVSLKQI